mmetsp:Transcript_27066/g.69657  ORF Transcript_27066/g.69657 Transcript_27066/m.69657 type:complete len:308 (-) Transcript_27066:357-1280(-)
MLVCTLQEDGARVGVLDTLDKGVLLFTKSSLVHEVGIAEALFGHVVEGVHSVTTASEGKPLHVSLLGTAKSEDALLCKHIQGDGVNTLLVENDEALAGITADSALEVNHLPHDIIGKLPLGISKCLLLLGIVVEETSTGLGLLVLQRYVAGKDEAVLQLFRHVRVTGTVVHDETLDEARLGLHSVMHMHDLDHVKIERGILLLDAQNSINNDVCHHVGKFGGELSAERSMGYAEKLFPVDLLHGHFELLKVLHRQGLCFFKAIREDARVLALQEVALSLLEKLADDDHTGGGTVTTHVVNGSGSPRD